MQKCIRLVRLMLELVELQGALVDILEVLGLQKIATPFRELLD
ncbi:hypothetical protein [uncultured Fretibacterium sp.]|nr:hypothetical protein [uncultured Fretibacterium sp.]